MSVDNNDNDGKWSEEELRSRDTVEEYISDIYDSIGDPPPDINKWSKQEILEKAESITAKAQAQRDQLNRELADQNIDPNNVYRSPDGFMKIKSSTPGVSDVKMIKWNSYHLLKPSQRRDLYKLITKVGKMGEQQMRLQFEEYRTNLKQEQKLRKKDIKIDQQKWESSFEQSKKEAAQARKDLVSETKLVNLLASKENMYDIDRVLVDRETYPTKKSRGMIYISEVNPSTGKTYKSEGWKTASKKQVKEFEETGTILNPVTGKPSKEHIVIGKETFMKRYDEIPDSDWKKPQKCLDHLNSMYKMSGVTMTTAGITQHCQQIAKNLGIEGDRELDFMVKKAKAMKEADKMSKQFDLQEEVDDLVGVYSQIKEQMASEKKSTKKLDARFESIMGIEDIKTQKRQLANLLSSQKVSKPGFMEGIKAKIKVKAGIFPGLEKLREEGSEVAYQRRMGSLLDSIRSSGTSASKRVKLTTELQATFDAAEASGFTAPSAVIGYLESRPEGSEVVSPLSEEEESGDGKLDVLKDVGSTIGSTVSEAGHGLGETLGGNTGSTMSDIGGEMAGMASNIGRSGTDLDQFGKGGSPLESMSTEHDDDAPIHGSMKLKSITLGKDTVGSGSLFEQTMAESGAGVKLGDWDPYAFRQPEGQEKRGEKFLRERGAPTEGEAGPVGGDIQPGTMAFDFSVGHGPGTKKLDLGAGQFTRDTHQDITTKERSPLDLGLGSSFTQRSERGDADSMEEIQEAYRQKNEQGGLDLGKQSQQQGTQDIVKEVSGIGIGASNPLPSHGHDAHPQRASLNLGTQPRSSINLGLRPEQRPSTGVNLLGLGNVKAPNVTRVTATKRNGNGSLIDQATGSSGGLDTSHLIGNTPKKKRKMNLFGGMPR